VHMIGHDDEFVKKEFALLPIMRESFHQKPSHRLAAENWLAICSDGCDKEYAVRVHQQMIVPMGKFCR